MRLTMMLVLALTVGLLGMHALGPAAALPSPVTGEHTSHHVATTDAGPHYLCPDDDAGPTKKADREVSPPLHGPF